jgi:radical SAM superfamily enzyme YgiQ (UPF0313 family)
MNILMLFPKYPEQTFWNIDTSARKFTGSKGTMAPLGLLTLAAWLPDDFNIRLIDRNIALETEDDWQWADVVFLSLMLVQRDDYETCLHNARSHHTPVAVGGPFTSSCPEEVAEQADWACYGEVESVVDALVGDIRANRRGRVYQGGNKTDMKNVKIPRYDLLPDINEYYVMPVQFSRGCPFNCEFCDIIEIYGRVPRTKMADQVLRELDTIKNLGFHGCIFIVDDNFVGNIKAALEMLRKLAGWNTRNKYPYFFLTEASLNLADDKPLMEAMGAANFIFVFIGIETPDLKLLKTANKIPNLKGNTLERIETIRRHGIHIVGGFVLGFDGEGRNIFEIQKEFIQNTGIGIAFTGLLEALPHTQLQRRLKREGRLLSSVPVRLNHTVEGMNFIPKAELTKRQYLRGLADLAEELYSPKMFFERITKGILSIRKTVKTPIRFHIIKPLLKQIYYYGIREKGMRRHYWKAFLRIAGKNPSALGSFFYDCFHYYHLYEHSAYAVFAIKDYLSDPHPADVLDQVISVETAPSGLDHLTLPDKDDSDVYLPEPVLVPRAVPGN